MQKEYNNNSRRGQGHNIYHYRDGYPRKGWGALIRTLRWDIMAMYQPEFAAHLGVSQQMLSRIERGEREPFANLIQMALCLLNEHANNAIQEAREEGNIKYSPTTRLLKMNIPTLPVKKVERPQIKPCFVCNGGGKLVGVGGNKTCTFCKGQKYMLTGY